jgi:oxygen-independent coproporphyrinogen-3 oxidase
MDFSDDTRPGADTVGEMLRNAYDTLSQDGYRCYYLYRQKFTSGGFENVGWAKPGAGSAYNLCMMEELCPVLAMGGGGSTKLVAVTGRIERIFNAKYPYEYIENIDKLLDAKRQIAAFFEREDPQ